jgi:hypothetical protein
VEESNLTFHTMLSDVVAPVRRTHGRGFECKRLLTEVTRNSGGNEEPSDDRAALSAFYSLPFGLILIVNHDLGCVYVVDNKSRK